MQTSLMPMHVALIYWVEYSKMDSKISKYKNTKNSKMHWSKIVIDEVKMVIDGCRISIQV